MKFLLALLACAALPLSGCSMTLVEPGDGPFVVTPEGQWSQGEIYELDRACRTWAQLTDGALSCKLGPDGDARAIRGATGQDYLARLVAVERAVYLDADRMLPGELGPIAMNAFGLASGMKLHPGRGILSSEQVSAEFTAADRESCRAAGFCR